MIVAVPGTIDSIGGYVASLATLTLPVEAIDLGTSAAMAASFVAPNAPAAAAEDGVAAGVLLPQALASKATAASATGARRTRRPQLDRFSLMFIAPKGKSLPSRTAPRSRRRQFISLPFPGWLAGANVA